MSFSVILKEYEIYQKEMEQNRINGSRIYTVTLTMNGRTERWVLLKIKENFEKKGREKLKKSKSRAFATRAKN